MALAQAFRTEDCTKWYAIANVNCPQNSNEWRFFCRGTFLGLLSIDLHRLRLQLNSLPLPTEGTSSHFHRGTCIQLLQQYFSLAVGFSTTCRLARDEPSLTLNKGKPFNSRFVRTQP